MSLPALLRRAGRFVLVPDAEWQAMAGEPEGAGEALAHGMVFAAVGPLTLVAGAGFFGAEASPVSGLTPIAPGSPMASAIGDFMFPSISGLAIPAPARGAAENLLAALTFYVDTLAAMAAATLMLRALAPWCGGRRDMLACLRVCTFGATPLLISEVGLALPSLLPLLAVGCVHACYVVHGGVRRLLGLSASDAAMLLGLAALVLLAVLPLAGVLVGALDASR